MYDYKNIGRGYIKHVPVREVNFHRILIGLYNMMPARKFQTELIYDTTKYV